MFHFTRSSVEWTILFIHSRPGLTPARLPHSEIHGSKRICRSPWLIAAYHVLHRLLAPRHPSCALRSLINLFPLQGNRSFFLITEFLSRKKGSRLSPRNFISDSAFFSSQGRKLYCFCTTLYVDVKEPARNRLTAPLHLARRKSRTEVQT